VHAYPDDETAIIVVREGSVTVKADDTRDVQARRGVVVTKDGAIRDASPGELDEALGWSENRFVVANRPLRHALKAINRWYATELVVRDSALLTRPVTVNASLQSSGDAIAALEKSGRLTVAQEGKTRVLRDAATPTGSR
jgi:ferric-dicitrate binding protein FerR (iron transport regulator)